MASTLPRLPSIRELIKLYGLSARSQLSQNFILDKNITDKIVRTAHMSCKTPLVIEVGPGPGLLSRSILDSGATNIVAIEKDTRFLPTLSQLSEASGGRLKVIHGNILDIPHEKILEVAQLGHQRETDPMHIIGNLPFNVASPLLLQWLHMIASRKGVFRQSDVWMTLMFQKEVAERLAAPPSTARRGRLAVMSQSLCDVKTVYEVPSTVFVPRPKVDAGVVQLVPKPNEDLTADIYLTLENTLRYFFCRRRKTVGHILRTLTVSMPEVAEEIDAVRTLLDVRARPENVSTEEYVLVAKHLCKHNIVKLPL